MIGERGFVNARGAEPKLTTFAASTVSAGASGTVGVISTSFSPSLVGFVSSDSGDSGSEFSLAATATFALAIAGSVTSETSFKELAEIVRTPSMFLYLSAITPTLKPSRNPELASTRLSLPAVVFPIENVASIPSSVTL